MWRDFKQIIVGSRGPALSTYVRVSVKGHSRVGETPGTLQWPKTRAS